MHKPKHLKLIILICSILAVDSYILFNYLREPYLKWRIEEVCSRGWDDWETKEECFSDSWECISLGRQLNPEGPHLNIHPLCVE